MKRITFLCGKYTEDSSDDRHHIGFAWTNAPHEGGNHPEKNFTGILPKSRFFGRKWLNNMLGEAKMKEFAMVKTEQSKMDCRFHGNDSQLEIGAYLLKFGNHQMNDRHHIGFGGPGVQSEGGNHPGKNFTGILPKSRFFGRKWLKYMLGGTKTNIWCTEYKEPCLFKKYNNSEEANNYTAYYPS